jgi:hypothetical protein
LITPNGISELEDVTVVRPFGEGFVEILEHLLDTNRHVATARRLPPLW